MALEEPGKARLRPGQRWFPGTLLHTSEDQVVQWGTAISQEHRAPGEMGPTPCALCWVVKFAEVPVTH